VHRPQISHFTFEVVFVSNRLSNDASISHNFVKYLSNQSRITPSSQERHIVACSVPFSKDRLSCNSLLGTPIAATKDNISESWVPPDTSLTICNI
jgi:hypothetical protein